MKKTTSEKQLQANRRNAQKCTGPKTQEGKAVARMNALKHGVLAKEALVRGQAAKESRREIQDLYSRFYDELAPCGPVEEMLVEKIVITQWRLRRVLRAESGEIALSVDRGHWRRRHRNPALVCLEWIALGDPIHPMEESAAGNTVLSSWLTQLRAAVEREGELTEAAIKCIFVGGKPHSLSNKLDSLRAWFVTNPDGLEPNALRARHQEQVFDFIESESNRVSWRKPVCEQHEQMEEDALQAAAALPSMDVLEKIMRYETMLERHLARVMTQLERLQRMRRGESVPPPLSMHLSERD